MSCVVVQRTPVVTRRKVGVLRLDQVLGQRAPRSLGGPVDSTGHCHQRFV
ncbi:MULTISPECIES: hypothetical protein [unclassified Streptomyces]|nr:MULTISPECIES: hypothetical protein [unclassified Streptomyces]